MHKIIKKNTFIIPLVLIVLLLFSATACKSTIDIDLVDIIDKIDKIDKKIASYEASASLRELLDKLQDDEDLPDSSFLELEKAVVTKHVDGDTVHITLADDTVWRLRMIGIDTPETVHPSKPVEYYGQEASDYTEELLFEQIVYLEKDVSDTDTYDRLLRYIWLEVPTELSEDEIRTKLFNARLVLGGYAYSKAYRPDTKYQDYLDEFQLEAQRAGLGIWDDAARREFELENEETRSDT